MDFDIRLATGRIASASKYIIGPKLENTELSHTIYCIGLHRDNIGPWFFNCIGHKDRVFGLGPPSPLCIRVSSLQDSVRYHAADAVNHGLVDGGVGVVIQCTTIGLNHTITPFTYVKCHGHGFHFSNSSNVSGFCNILYNCSQLILIKRLN